MSVTQSHPLVGLGSDLKDKVALVTGASRGIGRAVAIKLASLGATVAINYVNNRTKANETSEEIKKLGSTAILVQGDVSKESDAISIVQETIIAFGHIDILVNNAGIYGSSPIELITTEQYRAITSVNIDGPFFVTRAAVPHIQKNGTIINISSIGSKSMYPNISVYAMTKGALEGFTRALAVELGPKLVRVNCISPGYTDSDLLSGADDVLMKHAVETSFFKRLGTPEDIAEVAAFLAVPRSGAWITGANILANGGASNVGGAFSI
ncbi:hypothetical protein HK100_006867 [Physocladia obscura]|uniref:Uncharacterized protein n=1 Tax=Physocladia obscura TaxID=109957 RepID=A0AAD5T502_9FUNG|nr:hypothetical protein HK100_006867 [Physocladia obscura]